MADRRFVTVDDGYLFPTPLEARLGAKITTAKTDAITDATTKYGPLLVPDQLGSTENLNDLKAPTRKRSYAASVSGRPEYGYPVGAQHGILDVDVVRPPDLYILQTWIDTWAWFVARRRYYAGSWSEWVRDPDTATVDATISALVNPLDQRVTALEESSGGNITIQPGNAVAYGPNRPDMGAYPNNTTVYWNHPNGTTVIPPDYQGDGYVGRIGDAAGYTTMQVRKTNSVEQLYVSCMNPTTGRHITYGINGPSGSSDDQRRFIDAYVGPYTGTTVTSDFAILPRSNIEWAFQIDVDGNRQFAPYHGSNSAKAMQYGPPVFTDLHGAVIDVAGSPNGIISGVTGGIKIRQRLYVTHPDSGATRWVAIDEVRTILPDGMIQFEGVMTFLEDTLIGNFYAPMTPVGHGTFDQIHVLDGASYPIATTPPGVTSYTQIAEKHAAESFLFTSTSDPSKFVAMSLLNPDATLARGHAMEETGDRALQLEERDTGLVKLYPTAFASGSVVPAGTVWRFGAQWRYGETTDPGQYA